MPGGSLLVPCVPEGVKRTDDEEDDVQKVRFILVIVNSQEALDL